MAGAPEMQITLNIDTSQIVKTFERMAEAIQKCSDAISHMYEATRHRAGDPCPDVWEAFSLSLLDEPRPAYDPEDPKYLAAVQEQAENVARYLGAVVERRNEASQATEMALDARYPARTFY